MAGLSTAIQIDVAVMMINEIGRYARHALGAGLMWRCFQVQFM